MKQDVAAAKALHAEAAALPIRDNALLATLQDASTTYCLCGLPQKVADAMTACSSCGTLYHLACLGIAREKEPKRLICPVCAGRAGQRFVWAVRPRRLDQLSFLHTIARPLVQCTYGGAFRVAHCASLPCCRAGVAAS